MRRVTGLFTDRLYLSAVGVVVILLLCASYIFASVLSQPLTRRPDTVTVELSAAGGLYEGSSVTYRGVKIGRVIDIEIGDKGVEASVSLTSEDRVPKNSRVVVRSLSPVGEQYLDFQPRTDGGPWLEDGAVIPATSTDIPKSLSSTVIALNKVLNQIDDRKLRSMLVDLSTGLRGTGDDIGSLVDDGDQLLAELDDLYPVTDRLLRNGDVALRIATDNRGNLEDLSRTAKSLTSFLKAYDPELRRTLQRTPGQLGDLEKLVQEAQKVLPDFLSKGVTFSDNLATHDPHLAALLQSYQPGLGALANHIQDGQLRIELIFDADDRCRYSTSRRSPREDSPRALKAASGCSASVSTLQRGAAHAPGPVPR